VSETVREEVSQALRDHGYGLYSARTGDAIATAEWMTVALART
jgi:hypothetical protein